MYLSIFIAVSVIALVCDLAIAVKAFAKRTRSGYWLAVTSLAVALVDLFYLGGIAAPSYFETSLSMSLHFIAGIIMVICLLMFVISFTGTRKSTVLTICVATFLVLSALDIILFAMNPFSEIMVAYENAGKQFLAPLFVPATAFSFHMLLEYCVTGMTLVVLIDKLIHVPREYRITYLSVVIAILLGVVTNALFLYLPRFDKPIMFDYSIVGFTLCLFLCYWSEFVYRRRGLLNRLKDKVFEGVDSGIVLFDFSDRLVLCNRAARSLFPDIAFDQSLIRLEFMRQCKIASNFSIANDAFSVQCFCDDIEQKTSTIRCDYRVLKNDVGDVVGKLFLLTDMKQQTDLLTGFHSWKSFVAFLDRPTAAHVQGLIVAVCDINQLAVYNSMYGRDAGDRMIQQLAQLMRRLFPSGSYFVRGEDAALMAICYGQTKENVREAILKVRDAFEMDIQYAYQEANGAGADAVLLAAQLAMESMRTKKLLDNTSSRSSLLSSLVRALKETDDTTEEHVRRTQELAGTLARRLGLSDAERSKLSLLCVLHDIGKVGVPLEILNKPGKLTEDEKTVLRSHVEKGYQIAMSSAELQGIAECIRYHHECWDGTGYPDGLSRESIPLLSRILAVVDAYDAMINNRSYRIGMPIEKALEELRACAGTQFDPFIVSEFLQMIEETPVYQQEFLEMAEFDTYDRALVAGLGSVEQEDSTPPDQPDTYHVHGIQYSRYLLDENLHIIEIDDQFERLTGYSFEDVMERQLTQMDLLPEEDRIEYASFVSEELARRKMAYCEHRLRRKDGAVEYISCMGRLYFDSASQADRSEIIVNSVDDSYAMKLLSNREEVKSQHRMRQWEDMYRRDSMTGLLTQQSLRSDMEMHLLHGGSSVLMVMMDVDLFKEYNDTFGHQAGDELLIAFANALTDCLREGDLACRMGGDEYSAALFLPATATQEMARRRTAELYDKLNIIMKPMGNEQWQFSLSMGAALSSEDISSFSDLYFAADAALYESKQAGRGRYTFKANQ